MKAADLSVEEAAIAVEREMRRWPYSGSVGSGGGTAVVTVRRWRQLACAIKARR